MSNTVHRSSGSICRDLDTCLLRESEKYAVARVAELKNALLDLLDDTEHANHDCGDAKCPVARARAILAKVSVHG